MTTNLIAPDIAARLAALTDSQFDWLLREIRLAGLFEGVDA